MSDSSYVYADEARPDILAMVPPDGQVIVSVGCGAGATEAKLVEQGRTVHGFDVAPQAIELARPRLTSATLLAPGDPIPLPQASADGLILADVIEHMPAAWDALANMSKLVRPGGWVIISVPNMRSLWMLNKFILKGDWPEDAVGIFDRTHLQVLTHKRLSRWIDHAGLRIERWFDKYTPHGAAAHRLVDNLTLRLFHRWFMYQLQVRCRRI